jgi:hypothetical protein
MPKIELSENSGFAEAGVLGQFWRTTVYSAQSMPHPTAPNTDTAIEHSDAK